MDFSKHKVFSKRNNVAELKCKGEHFTVYFFFLFDLSPAKMKRLEGSSSCIQQALGMIESCVVGIATNKS